MKASRHDMLQVLTNPVFATVLIGQTVSLVGSRMYHVCLLAHVYQISSNPVHIGIMLMWLTLPTLVLGPLAGVLVDRFDRRYVMMAADSLRAVASLVLWLTPDLPTAYVVSAVTGVGQALFNPAWNSAIPDVVGAAQVFPANATWALARRLAHISGPAAAALIIARGDPRTGFLVNAATYLVSIGCLIAVRLPRMPRTEGGNRGSALRDLADLATLVGSRPILIRAAVLIGVHGLMTGTNNVIAVPFVYQQLGGDGSVLGLLGSALATGLFVGSLMLGVIGRGLRPWTVAWLSLAASGACMAWFGMSTTTAVAVGSRMVLGLSEAAFALSSITFLQTHSPPEMRGRTIGTMRSLEEGLLMTGLAVGGWATAVHGVVTVYIALGTIVLGGAMAAGLIRAGKHGGDLPCSSQRSTST